MGVITRGVKNAFRNSVRTLSVVIILAVSIGLSLIMLLSSRAVEARIASVQGSIGNSISISPAGARGFEGGGEPLTESQINQVRALPHVSAVSEQFNDRLTPGDETSLASAIDPGTLGNRFNRNAAQQNTTRPGTANRSFTLPIAISGISTTDVLTTDPAKLTAGELLDPSKDENVAVLGATLATKNNLAPGSTFSVHGTTMTVKGVVDLGNQFANAGLYVPIAANRRLSGQADQVSAATVRVDSITELDSVTAAIKDKLGTDKADVVSNADTAKQALQPLQNIRTITFYGLIGALVGGALITLLIMVMIVRERRREIGVLKAIGASNIGIVGQFVTESLVLTLLGGVLGVVVGALLSNPVLKVLVTNSTAAVVNNAGGGGGGRFGRLAAFSGQVGGSVQATVRGISTTVGPDLLIYGLLAAVLLAVVGSAFPAWLIAKVRPAEVMRGE